MPHPAELSLLLHRALEPRLARLLELCQVENWQGDPEGLHQVRIASRRVRAVLDLVDSNQYASFKRHTKHLRGLTRALGIPRELDVHVLHLESLRNENHDVLKEAAIEFLLENLDRKRDKARRVMFRRLSKITLKDLNRLLEPPAFPDPLVMAELPQAVWNCLEPWLRSVDEPLVPALEREDVAGLHALRIRVKRLRYTLEILEPAFPNPLEDWLQRLKSVQTALGNHHDLSMLEALLATALEGLLSRQHTALASGVQALATQIEEHRRNHFERFTEFGKAYREAEIFFHLKHALENGSGSMA
jgi:CHAD domain-containing protein